METENDWNHLSEKKGEVKFLKLDEPLYSHKMTCIFMEMKIQRKIFWERSKGIREKKSHICVDSRETVRNDDVSFNIELTQFSLALILYVILPLALSFSLHRFFIRFILCFIFSSLPRSAVLESEHTKHSFSRRDLIEYGITYTLNEVIGIQWCHYNSKCSLRGFYLLLCVYLSAFLCKVNWNIRRLYWSTICTVREGWGIEERKCAQCEYWHSDSRDLNNI